MLQIKNNILSKLSTVKSKWTLTDLQNIFCGLLLVMDFIIIKSPLLLKTLYASLFIISFFIPYLRRFTINAIPIFAWLITYFACQFIPLEYRPNHIFVNILPTLERILYGANLSEIISKHTHPILDVLTWLPYGIFHFTFPIVLAFLLFIYGPPRAVVVYSSAFGFLNIAGVLTQLLFPNASPWYELIYGSAPADYSIPGEPGGLKRIDDILGLELYGSTFGNSPLVFGAFPSLHSGCATIEMLFVAYLFPRAKPFAALYVMWMWFCTMYLTHHYMIDLVGGSIYALLTFVIAYQYLPKINPEYRTRLEYLGITKSSFSSYFYSIEDTEDYQQLPMTVMDTTNTTQVSRIHRIATTSYQQHRPEPLRLNELNNKGNTRLMNEEDDLMNSPALSPSSGVWSSSEPPSPITPHTPSVSSSPRMHFNKA